jgi:hypothetical protein
MTKRKTDNSPNQSSMHTQLSEGIFNDVSRKLEGLADKLKKQDICPPNTKGTGFTCFGTPREMSPPPRDDINIIPIFPMRFAMTGDHLMSLVDGAYPSKHPSSIHNHPNHELLRIRKGYLYIKDDLGYWHVFWYETFGDKDEHSSVVKDKTNIGHQPPYSFTKFTWSDGADSEWEILPTEKIYPYAYVNSKVKKCWVAYSEARWPPAIFEIADRDPDFLARLTTPVDLTSMSGDFHLPLSELASITDAFKDGLVDASLSKSQYEFENVIRKTVTMVEPASFVNSTPLAKEHGIIVAVTDYIGEILDLNHVITVLATAGDNYAEHYKYPLTIGGFVKQLQEQGALKEEYEESRNPLLMAKPLSIDYKTEYPKLFKSLEDLEKKLKHLLICHSIILNMGDKGSISYEARYLLKKLLKEKDGQIAEYLLFIYGRMFFEVTLCTEGQKYAECRVDPTVEWAITYKDSSDTDKIIEALLKSAAAYLQSSSSASRPFVISLNEFLRAFGSAVARSASRSSILMQTASKRLVVHMLNESYRVFRDIGSVTRYYTYMHSGLMERYGVPTPSDLAGSNTPRMPLPDYPNESYRINAVEVRQDLITNNRENFIKSGEGNLLNGIGLLASSYSIYTTIQKYNDPNYASTAVGFFANDAKVKIIAAFLEGMDIAFGENQIATKVMSSPVATRLFKFAPQFGNFAKANITAVNNAIGKTVFKGLIKRAAWIGIVLASFETWEGFVNKDIAALASGALAVVGGLIFITGAVLAWPVAVAGALLLIGSVAFSFFKDTDYETWAKRSFWGTQRLYMKIQRQNMTFSEKLKIVIDKRSTKLGEYNDYFNKECLWLMHLMYSPKIKNDIEGDSSLTLQYHPMFGEMIDDYNIDCSINEIQRYDKPTISENNLNFSITKRDNSSSLIHFENLKEYKDSWITVHLSVNLEPNGKFKESFEFKAVEI